MNIPQALDKFLLPQLRIDELFNDMAKRPEYIAYTKIVGMDDPAGDTIYHVYTEPLAAMPEWQGPRELVDVDSQYWTSTIRTFARAMQINVDDIKPDAGGPAKLALYRQQMARLVEASMLLWPGLVVQAVKDGAALSYTGTAAKTWKPDGQNIFDSHYLKPGYAALGTFRNYRSKDATGGGAAYPISYANELAIMAAGRTFKAPNGLDMPIRYTHVVCSPGNGPTLRRLFKADRLPAYEAVSGASSSAGGDVINAIKNYYDGDAIEVVELANMPSTLRLYLDLSIDSEKPLRLKERQPITMQYEGPGGAEGAFPVGSDEGMVSSSVFNNNSVKFGPKARGEAYFGNWWRAMLCDSTP